MCDTQATEEALSLNDLPVEIIGRILEFLPNNILCTHTTRLSKALRLLSIDTLERRIASYSWGELGELLVERRRVTDVEVNAVRRGKWSLESVKGAVRRAILGGCNDTGLARLFLAACQTPWELQREEERQEFWNAIVGTFEPVKQGEPVRLNGKDLDFHFAEAMDWPVRSCEWFLLTLATEIFGCDGKPDPDLLDEFLGELKTDVLPHLKEIRDPDANLSIGVPLFIRAALERFFDKDLGPSVEKMTQELDWHLKTTIMDLQTVTVWTSTNALADAGLWNGIDFGHDDSVNLLMGTMWFKETFAARQKRAKIALEQVITNSLTNGLQANFYGQRVRQFWQRPSPPHYLAVVDQEIKNFLACIKMILSPEDLHRVPPFNLRNRQTHPVRNIKHMVRFEGCRHLQKHLPRAWLHHLPLIDLDVLVTYAQARREQPELEALIESIDEEWRRDFALRFLKLWQPGTGAADKLRQWIEEWKRRFDSEGEFATLEMRG